MAEEISQQEADRRAYDDQREADRRAYEDQREANRRAYEEERGIINFQNDMTKEQKRIRLEIIRLAKETLIENSRHKAIDERDVSADDIITFANALYNYTNANE